MMPQAPEGLSFEIIQPGSTVMTSLSAAESNPKQCAVLEVCGTSFRIVPHTLRRVRPVDLFPQTSHVELVGLLDR